MTTRPPAVAGLFYPDDPLKLTKQVEGALDEARQRLGQPGSRSVMAPKAAIAPHAGYAYSGPVAASAYACIEVGREAIRRVVLAGPAHRFPLRGVATVSVDALGTPLGEVQVDSELRSAALEAPAAVVSDEAHALEHSLEVHLPFLQLTLGSVPVLPLLVGQVAADAAADVLDAVFGGTETLVVVSTDLSHYYDYPTARALDRVTADAIVARRPEGVGAEAACGVFAVRGLLVSARRHDLSVELVDLRSSGDTAGPRDQVVGYGSFVLA